MEQTSRQWDSAPAACIREARLGVAPESSHIKTIEFVEYEKRFDEAEFLNFKCCPLGLAT
jgi:hypothetical protein